MKRNPSPVRLPSKEEIRRQAEAGVFDLNPLLATPHRVICRDCGYGNRVVFLEYLRSGKFEIGKTEMIEVTYAAPTAMGLGRAFERSTPLVFGIECGKCGAVTGHSPLSLEYLLFTTRKRRAPNIYV